MNIDYLIKLTLAIYRVTELFPEEEIKYDIRNLANKILVDLISLSLSLQKSTTTEISNNINTLGRYFKAVEPRGWVDSRNFLVLWREYNKIKKNLEINREESLKEVNYKKPKERQKRIIEFLKKNGKVKMKDLMKIFPEVNRRTLLRDLEDLIRAGIIGKEGNGREATYLSKQNVQFSKMSNSLKMSN